MSTGVEISYGLFDVTAKSDSTPAITDKQSFVNMGQLKETDLQVEKYGTLEPNQFVLDGTFQLFPDEPEHTNIGLWSLSMTDSAGTFAVPPVLTVNFAGNHSSMGLTFFFAVGAGDFCNSLNIKWYDGADTLLLDQDYTPDSDRYFAEGQVENYRKVVITFYSTNRPYRYLKLAEIKYGVLKIFTGESILSANVLEEIDPLSAELSINTLDFKVHTSDFAILNPQGAWSLLQRKQQVDVVEIVDGVRRDMGTYYLEEPESDSDRTTSMSCIDLIGIMDQTSFRGGMYTNVLASTVIDSIMTSAGGIEYDLDSSFAVVTVSGYIPICTHREALQQVAFAIGAIVDCTRGNVVKLYPTPTASSGSIPYARKMSGHTLKLKALVTGVEVTAHNYTATTETQELLNEARAVGTYEITFDSPMHSLAVTGATITESGANYAKITVATAGTVVLTGKTYNDAMQLFSTYRAELPAGEKTNVLKIEEATLVSNSNAQGVADRVYEYYQNRYQGEGPIVLDDEEPGQMKVMDSLNSRQVEGIIEALDIDLAGGFRANARIVGKAVEMPPVPVTTTYFLTEAMTIEVID
ncbi:MAG TPA: hypothetical protein VN441_16255 [Syntrophomonas sp.]|nr:hypothetical protein [Syntrophomonas sp.]